MDTQSTPALISSQRYLDAEIVAQKVAAGVFVVSVSPVFEIGGERFRVILDGHHAFAAAKAAGFEPEIVELSKREHDAISLLDRGEIEDFLEVTNLGDDYYFAASGLAVWQ